MKLFILLVACLIAGDSFAVSSGRSGRRVVDTTGAFSDNYSNNYRSATQVVSGPGNIPMVDNVVLNNENVFENFSNGDGGTVDVSDDVQNFENKVVQIDPELEKIKKYRDICLNNNIGIGNTFVWAARNSNIDNYSFMVEDVKDPKNNTCFVKVSVNSTDSAIDLSDIKSKYFEMGKNIVCASWVDENLLEKRILDAKKSARTWATVGGVVGGAAVGVGAMELFGNKLIGGAVQGQKALEGQDLLISQILVVKNSNETEYKRIIKALEDLESVCSDDSLWVGEKPQDCDETYNPFIGLREKLK